MQDLKNSDCGAPSAGYKKDPTPHGIAESNTFYPHSKNMHMAELELPEQQLISPVWLSCLSGGKKKVFKKKFAVMAA